MANDLNIRIKINSDTKALEVTSEGFNKLGKTTDSASREVERSTDRIAGSIDNLSSKASKAAGIITGVFAFDKLKDGAEDFLSTAAQFEQYAVSLEVLSGSAAKAQEGFDWIKNFTATTPYTLDETTEAFIRLKAYGIDATDGSLKTLGDTSAALSKPLMAAVEAMADAMTGENERLKEFGITASVSGKKIAYNWIDSSGAAKTKIIDNNKQIIKSTLEAIFNEKYSGMMDKQSQTLNGLVSNFEDTWTNLENTITNNSGAFDIAKTAISGATAAVQTMGDHLDDIVLYGKYTLEAASAVAIYQSAVVGVNTVQKLHAKYVTASTVATTAYNIATNTTTTSVERLTFAQVALNTAMKANPWLIAGTAAVGLGVVLTNEMDKFNTASKNALEGIKNLQTADSVQKEIDRTVNALSESRKKIANWDGFDSVFGNKAIEEKNAARLENRLKFLGSKLTELGNIAEATTEKTDNVKPPLSDAEINKQKKAIEALNQAYSSINQDITELSASDHDKAMANISEKAQSYRKAKVDELTISKYVSAATLKLNSDELQSLHDAMSDALTTKEKEWSDSEAKDTDATLKRWDEGKSALLEYYSSIDDSASIFAINESDRIQQLAASGILTNEQMLAIWGKDYEQFQKEQREKDNKFLIDVLSDYKKAMDNQLFDAMTGKWNDFGDWLKDFWSSVTTSIARAASAQLSNVLIDGLQNMITGTPGISTDIFRMIGNGVGVGTTLTASEQSSIMGMSGSIFDALSGNTTTSGGTVINAEGQITSAGSDIMSLASNISSLKTAYSLFDSGIANIGANIEAAIAPSIETIGSLLQASQVNIAGATVGLGAGALGGIGGYAVGSLGDALFGADTQAGTYGAIGGATGAAFGSLPGFVIGSALGSVIGGLFGKKKVTDSGIQFLNDTSANSDFTETNIIGYEDWKKKSWFGTKRGTTPFDLEQSKLKSIEGIFDTYDYLLAQLGSIDHITLAAGKYSKDTFEDQLSKNFIATFTGIPEKLANTLTVTDWESVSTGITAELKGGLAWTVQQVTKDITSYTANPEFDALYQSWTDYADSVDKTVMEALSESVNTFISSQRTFDVWSLERSGDTTESLRKQAEWLQQDFQNLESMIGVTGVTVENFSQMYSDAVKNSFDPTTISQWDSLSSALMSATDAQDKYLNSIGQTTTAAEAAAAALQAASNALNNNLKVEQLVSSTQQIFAANDTESAKFAAQSARTQYEMLKSYYGLNVSDSEFLATMQSSLTGAGRTDANVSMWSDLTNAFQSAYNAEKQYSSILSDAEAAKLEEQQRLADASVAAAQEIASAAEEAAKKLTELKIQSRDYLRSFNEYLYKDDALNLAAYQVQYLTSDLSALEKQAGISNVSLSSFTSMYEKVIAQNFNEDTINLYEDIGNTLMKMTDAQKAYNDALKASIDTGFINDMLLTKTKTSSTSIELKQLAANNTSTIQLTKTLNDLVSATKENILQMKLAANGAS